MAVRTGDRSAISEVPTPREIHASGTTYKLPTAIWLVHDGERWLAFSNQAPHPRWCDVEWMPDENRFGEHRFDQVFDRRGVNVAGPAPLRMG